MEDGGYKLLPFFADVAADIYPKINNEWSCLKMAVVNGHLNLYKALVEKHDFEICLKDINGWTALHPSTRSGNYDFVNYSAFMGADV